MTEKPETVRIATWRDESAIYSMLIALHAHNDAGWQVPYSPQKVLSQIEVGTRPDPDTRTNRDDRRAGWIGVIGPEGGRLAGTVGLFIEPASWFADEAVSLIELWLFVRPEERDRRRLEQELFAFADRQHEAMKAELAKTGYRFGFELQTGFMHRGARFDGMARLWRRMSRAEPVGMLFSKR